MKRRLNATGRLRITREMCSIRVEDDPTTGVARFSAELSGLARLGLDGNARVIVEPYVKQSSMRFDFGSLSSIVPPADTSLREIDRGAGIQFRIKVVDTANRPGKLLALADRVRPSEEDEDENRKAILPLRETDLGEAVWKMVVSREDPPCLLINRRIPGLRARLYEDPLFMGAIFPVAVRDVMRVILDESVDTEEEWVSDWRSFAESLLREPIQDEAIDDSTREDLVDRVVEAFCERQHWASSSLPIDEAEDEVPYE